MSGTGTTDLIALFSSNTWKGYLSTLTDATGFGVSVYSERGSIVYTTEPLVLLGQLLAQFLEEEFSFPNTGKSHFADVSKCIEFQGPADRAGDRLSGNLQPVWCRLRELHQENECRSCWYAFRGEVEGLYGVSGLLRALPALLRS